MKANPAEQSLTRSMRNVCSDWTDPLYEDGWDDDTIANLHHLVTGCWNVGAFPKKERAELWGIMVNPVLAEFFDDPRGILKKVVFYLPTRNGSPHP